VEPERGGRLVGVTKSTVQTHLERALVKLRAALEVTEDV
jgi:DNA-directed RNA polymerase specialized sigma24 family protein